MRTFTLPNSKAIIMVLVFTLISVAQTFATTYYSRTNLGLWNANSTWSTVTYGNATNMGTYPKAGDIAMIGNTYTVYINMNVVCGNVTVGQGKTGGLQFMNTLAYTMTITGNLTVNSGAVFNYVGNTTRSHTLLLGGNLINHGNIDFYSDVNDLVNLTFNSNTNSVVSGTGTFDLNRVTVGKTTSTANYLEVQANAFETATRQLDVLYGTFNHNNLGSYSVNSTLGAFTLGPNGIIKVPMGTVTLSPTNQFFYLEGSLIVNGGSLKIGFTTGVQGLRYSVNGTFTPSIAISAGTMEVYGGITYKAGAATAPLNFNMSGGTLLLNSGSTGTALEVFRLNDVANSNFTMSSGSIILQKPTSNVLYADFAFNGSLGTNTTTGGYVEFGNASTANNSVFNFMPYPLRSYPYFKVNGPAANSVTLKTAANTTANFQIMGLSIGTNKTFDIRSISGTAGDSKVMRITDTYDGINAIINNGTFVARTGTVLLQAGEGQWMSGTTTTALYNLTVNNSFGVSLGAPINVTGALFMQLGILYSTPTNIITCKAGASSNIGSSTSYIDGSFAQEVASAAPVTFSIPTGKSGAYRPMILSVSHSSAATVTYTSNQVNSSARALSYTLPGTLQGVSKVRYYTINRSAVANLINSRITLSYSPDDGVNDYTNLRVARDNGASGWLDVGGAGTANTNGSITSAPFAGFNTIFTLGNSSSGINTLPVELMNFTVAKKSNHSELNWSTASENNSSYFEIQRSDDGSEFISLGKINSAGNSNTVVNYQFVDHSPSLGLNYYRLKQVDIDGSFTYTATKSLRFTGTGIVSIYPNPTSAGNINMAIPEGLTGNWTLRLYDINGKMMLSEVGNATESNVVQVNPGIELPSGMYSMQLISQDGMRWQDKIAIVNE